MSDFWEITEHNVPNKDTINEFLLSLKIDNKSILTIKEYKGFLVRFFKEVQKDIKDLNKWDILNWLDGYSKNRKAITVKNRLSYLSTYFNYCVDEGYVEKNFIVRRWKPRIPKPLPKYLERVEVTKVRMVCEKECLRNQVLFEFLLTTGCRVREAFNVNIDDIDFKNRTVTVLGKGGKIRDVFYSEYCAVLMEKYLQSRGKFSNALFVGIENNRLSIRGIQKIICKLGKQAGLERNLSPHCLRHTYATMCLENGATMDKIQDDLGHADVNTASIYANLPLAELYNTYHNFME